MSSADNGEDFPIICESCLGSNPYMRMTTQNNGMACKLCTRPFKTYRWLPGAGMRYRRTEICPTCSRIKNICQTCMLDLEYGMTTRVRDAMLGSSATDMPSGEANRLWQIRSAEEEMNRTGRSMVDYGRIDALAKETLSKMARSRYEPYARPASAASRASGSSAGGSGVDRKETPVAGSSSGPRICPNWLKGRCNKGSSCSLRHEVRRKGTDQQSSTAKTPVDIPRPATETVVMEHHVREEQRRFENSATLHVANIPENALNEKSLRLHFEPFGKIRSVVVSEKAKAAFINFVSKEFAEKALNDAPDSIEDSVLQISWGKNQPAAVFSTPSASVQNSRQQKSSETTSLPGYRNPVL